MMSQKHPFIASSITQSEKKVVTNLFRFFLMTILGRANFLRHRVIFTLKLMFNKNNKI